MAGATSVEEMLPASSSCLPPTPLRLRLEMRRGSLSLARTVKSGGMVAMEGWPPSPTQVWGDKHLP